MLCENVRCNSLNLIIFVLLKTTSQSVLSLSTLILKDPSTLPWERSDFTWCKASLSQYCCVDHGWGSTNVLSFLVPTGLPSRGRDVTIYVFNTNQPSLLTLFVYSVLVSFSVFVALSTVFHSINSPDTSPLSHSVLPTLFLPYWSFQQYISVSESLLRPWCSPLWLTRLKAPTN